MENTLILKYILLILVYVYIYSMGIAFTYGHMNRAVDESYVAVGGDFVSFLRLLHTA